MGWVKLRREGRKWKQTGKCLASWLSNLLMPSQSVLPSELLLLSVQGGDLASGHLSSPILREGLAPAFTAPELGAYWHWGQGGQSHMKVRATWRSDLAHTSVRFKVPVIMGPEKQINRWETIVEVIYSEQSFSLEGIPLYSYPKVFLPAPEDILSNVHLYSKGYDKSLPSIQVWWLTADSANLTSGNELGKCTHPQSEHYFLHCSVRVGCTQKKGITGYMNNAHTPYVPYNLVIPVRKQWPRSVSIKHLFIKSVKHIQMHLFPIQYHIYMINDKISGIRKPAYEIGCDVIVGT